MVEYSRINCNLTNVQLNKLKKVVKSNEGATLRLGIKNFNKDESPHELLLTTRQSTKLRNAINNNSAIDIKLSKAQIKKLIQSGGFLGKLLSNCFDTLPLSNHIAFTKKVTQLCVTLVSSCRSVTTKLIVFVRVINTLILSLRSN